MQSGDQKTITGAQLRAARALIRWSAEELAGRSKLGVATIRRAEAQDGEMSITAANQAALRSTLEKAGVEFIPENGGGPGVRLKRTSIS
jgi:transcriptional regulator with XRE-family HTH domain